MNDYISLGAVPCSEECAQVGSVDYVVRELRESRAYIHQLKRMLHEAWPPIDIPLEARIHRKVFAHDMGSYAEVVVTFDDMDEEATHFAYNLEGMLPDRWDDEALLELNRPEHVPPNA